MPRRDDRVIDLSTIALPDARTGERIELATLGHDRPVVLTAIRHHL